jgi:type II secretory pathway component PulF
MALIITPGQFTRRAEFYRQLAQYTSAGIGLVGALENLGRNPPERSYRQPIQSLLKHLAQGCTLTEGLKGIAGWLPTFDVALLEAGEHSGRLDACLRLLANYYLERARIARQLVSDLAYPAFLFHFFVFITPFPQLFLTGNLFHYLFRTFGVLIPIYAFVALLIYMGQSGHGEQWRAMIERLIHPIPVLGTARRQLAIARLAAALEALLSAGVTIIEAWDMAATASGSPALRRTVLGWRPLLDAGQTPSEVLSAAPGFPDMFKQQYTTGEISGQLEDTLGRMHQYYQEEGTHKLHTVSTWVPRAIYCLIMLVVAIQIVSFYKGYFQNIQNIGGF